MRVRHIFGTAAIAALASVSVAQTIVQSFPHATGATPFAGGVAYDPIDDSIWVFGADTITSYTRTGTLLKTLAAPFIPGGTLNIPLAIGGFVDPATGNIWVGDEGELVYEMDRSGNVLRSWSTLPTLGDVSALTYDPCSDTVWVCDDLQSCLQQFDKNGNPLRVINLGPYGYFYPDPDGATFNPVTRTFYIGDDLGSSIKEVDLAGVVVNSWPFLPRGISPEGLACDTRTGSIFVAEGFNSMVHEVSGIVPTAPTGAVVDFGTGCPDGGGTIPILRVSDVVRAGSAFSIAVQTSLPPGGGGTLTALLFDTQRRNTPLGFLGAPSCSLLALAPNNEVLVTTVNHNRRAGFTFCLPASTPAGATVVMQAINLLDPSVPGQISTSNGTEIVIQP